MDVNGIVIIKKAKFVKVQLLKKKGKNMDAKTAINIFRTECERLNLVVDDIFIVGRGSSRTRNNRYGQSVNIAKVQEQHLYAVQFCKDIEVFVAWNLKKPFPPKRSKFSVKSEELIEINDKEIHRIIKNVAYSGQQKEVVLAFRKEAITDFIKRYIITA